MTTKSTPTPPVQSALAVLDPETTAASPQPAPEAPAAVAMACTPRFTCVLPLEFVTLDMKVGEAFLSDDPGLRCAVAATSGSTLLMLNAGMPLEKRELALQDWRKERLAFLGTDSREIATFLATHPEYAAGKVDLFALDCALRAARELTANERMEVRIAAKKALNEAVAKHALDDEKGRFPNYCVIRGDASVQLFRHRKTAIQWGGEGNHGFHLIPLDITKRECRFPAFEVD